MHQQVQLEWYQERSTWNCADWEHIVFSDKSRFLLCPDDRRKRSSPQQERERDKHLEHGHFLVLTKGHQKEKGQMKCSISLKDRPQNPDWHEYKNVNYTWKH
ncbi:hypothetical protein LAZ67_14003356 [Cordylochernes scorpioides]|uniref:Uncharacterized protein n=1 Tax=Cordylochernes scorpioides TaxID=51811 RepID=A0ABY6L7J3_9ARAC|nr:hypothetical protein LAZ67_14003356 [Cordylochernes scorpioides]